MDWTLRGTLSTPEMERLGVDREMNSNRDHGGLRMSWGVHSRCLCLTDISSLPQVKIAPWFSLGNHISLLFVISIGLSFMATPWEQKMTHAAQLRVLSSSATMIRSGHMTQPRQIRTFSKIWYMEIKIEGLSSFRILNRVDCVSLGVVSSFLFQMPTSCLPNETKVQRKENPGLEWERTRERERWNSGDVPWALYLKLLANSWKFSLRGFYLSHLKLTYDQKSPVY